MVFSHKKKVNDIKLSSTKKAVSSSVKIKVDLKAKRKLQDVNLSKIKKVLIHKSTKKILSPAKKILKVLNKKKIKPSKKIIKKKVITENQKSFKLKRFINNPIISPSNYSWESEATLNPAAIMTSDGVVHLFYRALGPDGISRIGYISSHDGINFNNRLSYPVYILKNFESIDHHSYTSPARYNPSIYTSGGGWGGCEDPRTVLIDGVVYMTFNVFNGWNSMRVAVASIKEENIIKRKWIWETFSYLSKPGDRQKNWVLFPEKINGKFALFYNLDKGDPNRVYIAYLNKLDYSEAPSASEAPDPQKIPDHDVSWHYRTRSAACPPIKTKDGWLLLYHAMEKKEPNKYKLGAMLLDLDNPEKVICRSKEPILEPDEWYENDGKPGIIYANGAIIKNNELIVYYGGGDKYVCIATINLGELLDKMKNDKIIKLRNIKESILEK